MLTLISIALFSLVNCEIYNSGHSCYQICLNYSMAIGKLTHEWCSEYASDDLCKTAECWSMCRDLIEPENSIDFYSFQSDNTTELVEVEEEDEDELQVIKADEHNNRLSLFEVNSRTLYIVLAFLAVQLNVLVLLIACGVRRCSPEGIGVEII
ncbi:unnamed protein product [Bursaphelenchus okinawaensis]|uniref:ShKT domain-containing protein n=1 Tax=Bursaphelenchus okinawaensis TaxID=465554 RepID=A0A811LBD8_9BILA|nr:unnamed protein product [Bursaphelenchus okinawaensis]CAG9120913.1 unnamed protein product [Bursaphelenchus okinawaensis]